MSEIENSEQIQRPEGDEETGKTRGRPGPPIPRGQKEKNLGRAARPGFRDPANARSKASKKGGKKRRR